MAKSAFVEEVNFKISNSKNFPYYGAHEIQVKVSKLNL